MDGFLRQSTVVNLPVGPFLDSTDGITAETGLLLTQPDIRLKKNDAAWAQKSATQTLAHEENGYYEVALSATDTDTVGLLRIAVHEAGAVPVWHTYQVVEEAVYDQLFAASAPGAATVTNQTSILTNIAGVQADTDNLQTRIPAALVGGRMDSSVGAMATDVLTSTALAGSAVTKLQAGLATAASIAALNNVSVAQVNAEVDAALADIHLDHLLAVAYDPAAKPGAADALFNELVESDAGVARYTANALEQAPAGGGGGGDGSGFTAIPWNTAWDAEVNEQVDLALTDIHLDHLLAVTYNAAAPPGASDALWNELIENDAGQARFTAEALEMAPTGGGGGGGDGSGFTAIPWNPAWDVEVNEQVDVALTDIHLDHLLAATYNPAAPPGVADALWNELVEHDAGAPRFTAEALAEVESAVENALLTLNDLSLAEVQTATEAALTAYDAVTQADLTALSFPTVGDITAGVLETIMPEDYAAVGDEKTLTQALYEITQLLQQSSVIATTMFVTMLDGTTEAFTLTLDDAVAPTSIERLT